MFKEWGYLLGEVWTLLALAGLLGLLIGWWIWGRIVGRFKSDLAEKERAYRERDKQYAALRSEYDDTMKTKDNRINTLEADLEGFNQMPAQIAQLESRVSTRDSEIASLQSQLGKATDADSDLQRLRADIEIRENELAKLKADNSRIDADRSKIAVLQTGLSSRDAEITKLRAQISNSTAEADLQTCRSSLRSRDARVAELEKELANARVAGDTDGDGTFEGKGEGRKPSVMAKARDGKADDLKLIKGVGPKLEKLCNKLGFFHFDQVAAWTKDEVAWVDANLEGFSGRVTRDKWVQQAKVLAKGGTTEFAKRAKSEKIYD
jgi:predicted flap endonuclease-1-like 5' DNA nuclease